jgi:CheY-like chemotaxis protein
LIVEDNPGDVSLFLNEFREIELLANFNIVTNGMDALKFLYHEDEFMDAPKPDLLVLDLHLPKIDGKEILTQMCKEEDLWDIPVVIFSALANGKVAPDNCTKIPNHIFIPKPDNLEEYPNVIKTVEKFLASLNENVK